jgi:hypothetical protein
MKLVNGMNKLIAYDCRSEYYTIKPIDLDYIKNNMEVLHFNSIVIDLCIEIEEGLLIFTDEKRPISIGNDYVYKNYLAINGKYFNSHKDEVLEVIKEYGKKGGTTFLQVDSRLLDDENIKVFENNKRIEKFRIIK